MNELDKHYGVPSDASHPGASTEAGVVSSAKAALGSAAATARTTVADATDAAREQLDTARRSAGDIYARTTDWAGEKVEAASRTATYARRRTFAHANRSRSNVEKFVDENPVMVGVAGLAAGLLVGVLLPGTRRENQAFGAYADDVKDQGYRYVRDLAEQGRHFVEENVQTATAQARPQGSPERQG